MQIILYGIGEIFESYFEECIEKGVDLSDVILTDSDRNKWGKKVHEKEILSVEEALCKEYDSIIVTADMKNYAEIKKYLIDDNNIDPSKVLSCYETIVYDKSKNYNFGNMKFKEVPKESCIITQLDQYMDSDSFNDMEKFFFYGSHKIMNKWLHYFEAYERFFSKYKNTKVRLLEIGVCKGGSLDLWNNYFENRGCEIEIYGVDIDEKCKEYESENVKIIIGSQEDRKFLGELRNQIGEVDILIDDGGHTMNQQLVTFEEMFDMVKSDGVYLCEDLHTSYWESHGGEYKGETFIEFVKKLIDSIHANYSHTDDLQPDKYTRHIKSISVYDSMAFFEKKECSIEGIHVQHGH